ncbi:PK beta-barrel-protein domain-containing protein-like protein [Lophiostoma macrostomum CBS 122681]|uniref:PK beta-barrel-protein domain-containing protein-like protein n=1 Tax=Lophiostoma macrostomum CBS 122681 TaxID=1314788 RepID=A0A6A6T6F6_9PLEO|nr:PK beta-barrel-protein domain-containing protein-like protein [Lophiostoma macrostomum CBS 122681]
MPGPIVDPLLNPPHGDTFQHPPAFSPLPLSQLRAGKIKSLWGKGIASAIYKTPLSGPVQVVKMGISRDEHAFPGHNSPDKALLHYSSSHYAKWKAELPNSAHLFRPGAFGENLYSEEIDETTMCIGDKVSIGEVLLEVTEPRAPCFKLNHRFETKDMAKRAQTLFRTGWLYRVLQPGTINPGDQIVLVERPHPQWTVARIMHYMYNEKTNIPRMREIVQLAPLGFAIKNILNARLEKGEVEDQAGRMFGRREADYMDTWNEYTILEKRRETRTVTAFVLEAVVTDKALDRPVEPGSHVRVKLGGNLVRAYSVIGGTHARFELGIALDAASRGGSKFLHEETRVGDTLTVGRITSSFPLAVDADRHIIIAGGIGITAFLAALGFLNDGKGKGKRTGKGDFELHFAVNDEVPFGANVAALGDKATVYRKTAGERLDLNAIVSRADSTTHIYVCGPQRLMHAVATTASQYCIPPASVHLEQFAVATSGDPFSAYLRQAQRTVEVGATQTLLEALKEVGLDVDSSCEVGNCGACRVEVCAGRVEHRGTGLVQREREGGLMLSCVSRGVGRIVLDL